jgi:hypothetical protein
LFCGQKIWENFVLEKSESYFMHRKLKQKKKQVKIIEMVPKQNIVEKIFQLKFEFLRKVSIL